MNKLPVVVIRASDNCFLDVMRCMELEGIPVIPVVFTWVGASPWIGEKSAFFRDPVVIENPATDENTAAKQMNALGEQLLKQYGRKLLLIATSDTALVFINKHYDTLGKYFLQPGAKAFNATCWRELSKDTFYQAMQENHVPIPLTYPVNSEEDIGYAVDNMVYPCVYKPSLKTIDNAFQRVHGGKKAIECADADTLRQKLVEEIKAGFKVVVQEKIEFEHLNEEVSCYLYADADGNIRMISGQHKIMEYPPKYGTGVVSETYFAEDLAAVAIATIKALEWHGFLGVETMYSKKHQKWMVIEANLRPWLSNYFQAAAGFNYLTMLYRDAYGLLEPFEGTISPDSDTLYRVNLTALINKNVHESENIHSALEKTLAFLEEHTGKTVFSYTVPQDPEPGRFEMKLLREKYPGNDGVFDRIEELMF